MTLIRAACLAFALLNALLAVKKIATGGNWWWPGGVAAFCLFSGLLP